MSRKFLLCALTTVAFTAIALSGPNKRTASRAKEQAVPKTLAKKATPATAAPGKPVAPPADAPAPDPATAVTGTSLSGTVALPVSKSAPVKNQRYKVVSSGKMLAMDPAVAVVYLEGNFPDSASPPRAVMHQKDFMFQPALLPVRTGTVVEFPNEDDTYHNVFSYSRAKRFDLGRYLPTEKPVPSQVFDKAGLVQLHCDIHEHMRAVILVLDTPYFTLTDSAGNFRLTSLPAGTFKLKAWINSAVTKEQPVTLTSGAQGQADFP